MNGVALQSEGALQFEVALQSEVALQFEVAVREPVGQQLIRHPKARANVW